MAKLPRIPASAQGTEKALLAVFPGARAGLTPSGRVGLRDYNTKRIVPVDQLLKELRVKQLATSPGKDLEDIKGAIENLKELKRMEQALRKLPPREGRRVATATEAAKLQAAKSLVDTGSGNFAKLTLDELTPADRKYITAALDMLKRQREPQRGKGIALREIPLGTRSAKLPSFEAAALAAGAKGKGGLVKGSKNIREQIARGTSPEAAAQIAKGPSKARLEAAFPVTEKDVASKETKEVTRLRESVGGSGNPKSKSFGESSIAGARSPKLENFNELRTNIISNLNDVSTKQSVKSIRDYYAKVDKAVDGNKISSSVGTSLKNRMVEDLMRSGVMGKVGAADAVMGRLAGGVGRAQDIEGKIISRMDLPGPYTKDIQGETPRLPVQGPAPLRAERRIRPRSANPAPRAIAPADLQAIVDQLRETSKAPRAFDLESGAKVAGRYKRNRLITPAGELADPQILTVLRKLLGVNNPTVGLSSVPSTGGRETLRQVANPVELVASLSKPNVMRRPIDPEQLRKFFAAREKALLRR